VAKNHGASANEADAVNVYQGVEGESFSVPSILLTPDISKKCRLRIKLTRSSKQAKFGYIYRQFRRD